MGQATMTPQITVSDAEGKADHVYIGGNRAGHAKKQDLPSQDRMWRSFAECQGNECM
jgi:hypothetical protein